jgi:hypothetical protein
MVDFQALMGILSVPRPNGSVAEAETLRALLNWLEQRGIPHRIHTFWLYPYFFDSIGVWLIVSRTLLALGILLRWGWPTLVIALVGLLGGLVDVATGFPLVTFIGGRQGENILIEFDAPAARREIVFSAHYDTKTELLDHQQRMFFLKNIRLGIVLTVALGLLGPLDYWLAQNGSPWASLTYGFALATCLPLLFLAYGLGLNLCLGRLAKPSRGAVDNGAACAVLLALAERNSLGELQPRQTRVTLALFTGEEVNMQGSRAYARERQWPLPAADVNLEVLAQDGEYVYWEQDGSSLKLVPTSASLNAALVKAVQEVTGEAPHPAGPVNSDGYSFLRVGVPSTTLGTYHSQMVDRGFHRPTDNLGRVTMERLPEAVEILEHFIEAYDRQEQKD